MQVTWVSRFMEFPDGHTDELKQGLNYDAQREDGPEVDTGNHGQRTPWRPATGRNIGPPFNNDSTILIRADDKNLNPTPARKTLNRQNVLVFSTGGSGRNISLEAAAGKINTAKLSDQRVNELWNSRGCPERIEYQKGANVKLEERIMIMAGPGRLGNKMFQYASLIGIARRNGFKPYAYSSDVLASVFDISHLTHIEHKTLPYLGEHSSSEYDSCLEVVPRNESYLLTGYYQSWRYFANVKSEVKKEFQFKDFIMREVRAFLNSSQFKNRTTIGVHVRRGDTKLHMSVKKGYTTAPKEYFLQAMAYFRNKYPDAVFVVCSDGMSWTKQNIVGKDVLYSHRKAEVDLAVLAHCQHSVISTGTFGWWAAWLAGGETIYYSNFPANNSWLATQYKNEDYMPQNWIGMGDK